MQNETGGKVTQGITSGNKRERDEITNPNMQPPISKKLRYGSDCMVVDGTLEAAEAGHQPRTDHNENIKLELQRVWEPLCSSVTSPFGEISRSQRLVSYGDKTGRYWHGKVEGDFGFQQCLHSS
ncbi:hypothetical protein MRB53_018472 [Persea americana]|uniref:Uncharacterized protein n=1 Tax=Persea americana TaxID=3435 RepID=A0ACC2M8P8_PERAE|nr:hypothetical protein MRB53_018472 [Persea americana]